MADVKMILDAGTSVGTLVLAAVTFASVRSANRAARVAERSLLAGLRPVLLSSGLDDPREKVIWMDDYWAHLDGGTAHAEATGDGLYMAISLRNVGSGLGVLHGWHVRPGRVTAGAASPQVNEFRPLLRDLYIPAGGTGYWHGAFRGDELAEQAELVETVKRRDAFTVDLLYGDHEGGQRTITRFTLRARQDGTTWMPAVSRHWNLDRADPR
jgi:hypothetical protein